ncbi:MAG: AAA domain-containing protein [Clostridia bacterium]|nr:AAA domain-containing protein [Clostridia bacterium]
MAFINLISAFSFTEFMGDVWNALTSKIALIVYSAVILLLVLILVIRVVVGEQKRVAEIKHNKELKRDAEEEEKIKTVTDAVDKKMSNLSKEIASVRSTLASSPFIIPATPYNGAPAHAVSGVTGEKEDGEKEEINEGGSRFYMLTEIDKEYENYVRPDYDDEIDLKELCEQFRNFSAGKLKLYYDIEDIRRFIGALAVTKLIILQGMSGTGKTSLAYAFGEFLQNKTVVVPIQPMWKERTDLVGYYNEFTRRFNETTLLYKMYEANNNEEIYVTVLDEMNIARVEYYFAEFLSLLEIPNPDGRNLDVVADRWDDDPKLLQHNGKLRLPTNMWFVGTANNDDSTFSISDKVYDRAMVLNLDKKATPFEAVGECKKISSTHLEELMAKAQREYDISDRNLRRIKKLDEYMIKTFHITFGNRIMKQIRCYVPVLVACGGTELEALDDILARKVFRKLESKNPVHVKQMADGVCAYLDELFGEDKLPLCKETIRLIEQNV